MLLIAPAMEPVAPSNRISFVQLHPETVMLVRVEPWEEQMLLLQDLPVNIVRVRHPLPACERMRVTKPSAIVVGSGVRHKDFELLVDEAYELRAAVLQVGQVPWGKLRAWLAMALDKVRARREAEETHEPPQLAAG